MAVTKRLFGALAVYAIVVSLAVSYVFAIVLMIVKAVG